jgi:hypothetical protein
MVTTIQAKTELVGDVQSVIDWAKKILEDDSLTQTQRDDLQAIHTAANRFMEYTYSNAAIIHNSVSPKEKQRIRHDLRNHLNIMKGFSRLFVKQLPDNLLIHMKSIRKIYATSQKLIEQVDEIR